MLHLKLRLRTLFGFVTLAAIGAATSVSDWIAGVGAVIAMAGLALCRHHWTKDFHLGFRISAIAVSSTLLWFSVVDRSEWLEWCDICEAHRYVEEFRLFGYPVYATVEPHHEISQEQLFADLGFPCAHVFRRTHLVRQWGLVVAARPAQCVLCCIGEPSDRYNEKIARNVRQFAASHPRKARSLYRKIRAGDLNAAADFVNAMRRSSAWPASNTVQPSD